MRGNQAIDRLDVPRRLGALALVLLSLAQPLRAQTAIDRGFRSTAVTARAASASATLRATAPTTRADLAADLAAQLRTKVRNGTWGVMVVSLTRGDTLFAENAGGILVPASTFKLYTTALAFERLGPLHRFSTDVLRDGPVGPDGVLQGNLILRGGGDPALSRRFFDGDANAPMRLLARQVAAAGVRRVRGDIVGDDHAFEAKPVPDGWLSRYLNSSYAAPVSALSLNENVLYVVVPADGDARIEPASNAYQIVNLSRSVAGSRGAKLTVSGATDGRITIRGWIGSRSASRVYVVVVNDPADFATGAFARSLAEAGVIVEGRVRRGGTPMTAASLTRLTSPPLAELAGIMNRESINHFAELIFRNVARQGSPSGVGSATMGNALLRDFLQLRVGSTPSDVYAADGSGLSTLDRTTPRSLVHLLSYADRASWSREFHQSLPVAGRDETLRSRMRRTPAQDNLHAKTGTTNDVIALSGYVSAKDGEQLAFAFLYNGKDRWNARATIDVMGATLAGFSR